MHKALTVFLWYGHHPCISLQKLFLPKRQGGANLPNIQTYNPSCLLRVGLDWLTQALRYSNFELQSQMADQCGLAALLHCKLHSLSSSLKYNLLLCDSLIAWREVRKKLGIFPFLSQYLPIIGHPLFPPLWQYVALGPPWTH